MDLRCALISSCVCALTGFAVPASAADGAEVELLGDAISRSDGAPAVFGYEPAGSPDLVSSSETEEPIGPHLDHEDAEFVQERLYQNDERVNADRSRGGSGTARGAIEAGHSIAVVSGWADAGSNDLGGSAEAHAGSLGASTGGAASTMRIEKRITILPGTSGLETGALVTGLAFELAGHGTLHVTGRTHPQTGGTSAGCGMGLLVLRGPTGTCGPFDCGTGALAVKADVSEGMAFQAENPNASGRTGSVRRHRSWTASYNAGVYKAGGVFTSGSDDDEIGAPITLEDAWIDRSDGVDTGGAPFHLDAIEFEANVGETLRVEMDLDVSGAVAGFGAGRSDFFDSFDARVVDPLGRGLVFESSVAVPEPGNVELARVAALALALGSRRSLRRAAGR